MDKIEGKAVQAVHSILDLHNRNANYLQIFNYTGSFFYSILKLKVSGKKPQQMGAAELPQQHLSAAPDIGLSRKNAARQKNLNS